MDKHEDKRKHPRIGANFVVSYRIKQHHENYDLSQTKNVSQGGIFLLFPTGSKLPAK